LHPDVKKLLEVQKVDQEVARIRKDLVSLPAETARRERRLTALRRTADEAKKTLMDAEVAQRTAEKGIKQADDEIKKIEVRLSSVKNNAEYQAMLFQIESVKKERSQLEEEGLGLLDKVESLRVQAEAAATELAEEESVFATFQAEATALAAKREVEAAKVLARRPALITDVPRELLERYDRLFHGRDHVAVCAVEGQICQGCHSKVTTGDYGRLHGGTVIVTCGSCQRILYLRE
jgi:predicted  nucleic acid-binding Zn-ribbon protein